jgi:hypothetical protein
MAAVTGAPEGFTYRVRKNGDVELFHDNRPARNHPRNRGR